MILDGAAIVLGVTGGIAAYKAVDLASKLVQAGANVDVIMTEAATRFVTPLPFQTITKRPVSVDMFQLLRDTDMAHISLADRADAMVVAPATANTIAKLAHGLADNLLTSTALATTAPILLAPAMDADMWANSATSDNVQRLQTRGVTIVGPDAGRLASGRIGAGRLVSTQVLLGALRQLLGRQGPLAGVKVLVTAGATQEPLDPVRHLTNRSSGRMGYAVAKAARDLGAKVTLVHGLTELSAVYGAEMVAVRTAAEMCDAVLGRIRQSDILIMAAAVADYRPTTHAAHKLKKERDEMTLSLERTQDILRTVAAERRETRRPSVVVGFAAETEDLLENAAAKLASKDLDLIVANDVSSSDSGFRVAQNRVTLLGRDGGSPEQLPLMPKTEVAEALLQRVVALWKGRLDNA